ncbi:MAG: hypothetical protein KatS3mg028_0435 [Bacteroidia bacterium]|nr:MAG: hypothetical protein KatS3mg028_0435 [Bacteroidia bacterium]
MINRKNHLQPIGKKQSFLCRIDCRLLFPKAAIPDAYKAGLPTRSALTAFASAIGEHWQVTVSKHIKELTAAGTVQDLHLIPFSFRPSKTETLQAVANIGNNLLIPKLTFLIQFFNPLCLSLKNIKVPLS